MLDESGFSLLSPLKRSWLRRGQTPTVRTSLSHHERLNVLGALCVTAGGRSIKLITRAHRRSLRGEEVIAFLSLLLRRFVGPVVLIWDQHPIHQRRLVQVFIERHPDCMFTSSQPVRPSSTRWNGSGSKSMMSWPRPRRATAMNFAPT